MKKTLVLLAVVGVLALVLWRKAGGGGEHFPASRAMELAPAETIAFVHLPDFERTRARWEKSDLRAITLEPEWQSKEWQQLLTRSKEVSSWDPDVALFFRLLPEIERLELSGGFLAVTSLDDEPWPKLVGGFPFRGKMTDVGSTVKILKDALFARWPGAKSELSSHHGIEIETITCAMPKAPEPEPTVPGVSLSPSIDGTSALWPWRSNSTAVGSAPSPRPVWPHPAVHLAFRGNWFFFSTDRALLTGALDRYLRRPEATKSLAENAIFAECRKHQVADADLIVWESKPAVRRNKMHDRASFEQIWLSSPEALQALQHTWRLDGPMRSRIYVHLTSAPEAAEEVKKQSLMLTTNETGVYAAIHFNALFGEIQPSHFFFEIRCKWHSC